MLESDFRRFNVWFSDTEPVHGRDGQLWVNTSNDTISRYDEGSWTSLGADVNDVISQITGAAPETLDTLEEIAAALNDNPNILDLYLTSTTASATYLSQSDAESEYLSKATASSTYLTAASASTTYLTTASASTTYLTTANASSTYLTAENASLTYLPISNPVVTGVTSLNAIKESVTVSATAAGGTVNYDVLSNNGVTYYTSNASANWTLNVRGNSGTTLNSLMSNGQSITFAFAVTNGSPAYYQTGFQIDGSAVSPKWQGGSAPSSGNTNSIDIYSFTIVKTAAATFTVWASQTKFA